jgi:uncharacterized repeat protein (TIGR03803 family)
MRRRQQQLFFLNVYVGRAGIGSPQSAIEGSTPQRLERSLGRRGLTSGTEQVVYSFKGLVDKDGAAPEAGLIALNGVLYGTTNEGGRDPTQCSDYRGCGTVFKVSTSGAEKVLYSFKGSPDGKGPFASLLTVNGELYGTTYYAGAVYSGTYDGTVFKVNPSSGKESVIYSFKGSNAGDGAYPAAGLISVNGVLYGTTEQGGVCDPYCGYGTVFKVSTSGTESVLHSFTGGGYYKAPDGGYPFASLIAVKGTLYGTTADGGGTDCSEGSGSSGCGSVFEVNPANGSESVVYSFKYGGKDGAYPYAGLLNVKGTLYGTTIGGGGNACSGDNGRGCGTVFSVTTSGTERVLYSFKGGSDGSNPFGGLVKVKGMLYGTTEDGGGSGCNSYGCGTVFEVSTTGQGYRVLHSFTGGSDGQNPLAGLVNVNGTVYGTTLGGGVTGYGTVFSLSP